MGTRTLFLPLATCILLAGCSSDDDALPPAPTQTAAATATLQATRTATLTHTATPTPTSTSPPTATPISGASARVIADEADLLTGPLAHGRVGDYLLENALARFVIQNVGQRDLYSVGQFGGNIIDAELRRRPGLDNFLEIQPAVNIETVINATEIEIVNDGVNGEAAVIRTCGPDDILDFVNPSTIVEGANLPFPDSADDVDYEVEACTEYILEPGVAYVRMETTIFNDEATDLGLFSGDYINGSGELDLWTSTEAGLGEILTGNYGVFSYVGIGEAAGVDYAVVPLPVAGSPIAGSSFFTASGVSYLLQSNSVLQVIIGGPPTFIVPAGGSRTYVRYFSVGDGSASNATDAENEVKGRTAGTLQGCVTVGGEPAPGARVAVGLTASGRIGVLATYFVTGADGCYSGSLTPGRFGVAASQAGVPFEGGATLPAVHVIDMTAGATLVQDIALPATGRVAVHVRNESGARVPGRISAIGFDPSPEPILPSQPLPGLGQTNTGLFNDVTKDAIPFGFAAMHYTDASGEVSFDLEPGTYELYVSRGVEYSLFSQPITVTAGQTTEVQARIARVVDTPGFVSSDFHVHGINSADSRVNHRNRVRQFAGEGVDNIIMTDHHSHTDLRPVIAELGFTSLVNATVGEEITTWDYGHFNAYPLLVDPTRPSGGSTDWAVAAAAGRDFTEYGSFGLTPEALFDLATTGPQSTPDTAIQINHIDSFFDPLQIDTAAVPPTSFISAENKVRFRIDPASGNLFHPYHALELWNGAGRNAQDLFLDTRIGVWMNHLNQGIRITAIADTDTHEFLNLNTAGARTWTAAPADDVAAIGGADVARAVKTGRAVGGQGVYVQTRLRGDGVADLTLGGSNTVRPNGGAVDLDIFAQAPIWAPYDRIEIYANAQTIVAKRNGDVPTLYGAEPTRTLIAPDDFQIERMTVVEGLPGAERWESQVTARFENLQADTWFVVVVRGTDGVSTPMFPVFAHDISRTSNTTLEALLDGNLGEGGVLSLGFTNALYADVEETPAEAGE